MKIYGDHIPNKTMRSRVARFRCESHKLNVEVGRWKKIPRTYRLCRFCDSQSVEDEDHVLLDCKFFDCPRQKLYSEARKVVPFFDRGDDNAKKKILFGEVFGLHSATGRYVSRVMKAANEMYQEGTMLTI